MAKTAAATIGELRRAGYPFNPTRAANWQAGILAALLAGPRKTDRTQRLAERTLKQMGILTKGTRRAFILKQIEQAIRNLCVRNILVPYAEGRVRLQHEISPSRLEALLGAQPMPWADEVAAATLSDTADDAEGGTADELADALAADNDDAEVIAFGSLLDPLPRGLPPLLQGNHREDPSSDTREKAADPTTVGTGSGAWTHETSSALSLLVGLDASDGDRTPHEALGSDLSHTTGIAIPSLLQAIATSLQALEPGIGTRSAHARRIVLGSDPYEVELDWRRGGDVRGLIRFPVDQLDGVLRYIGATWEALRIGVDQQGRPGVHHAWSVGAHPETIAGDIIRSFQILDDARGT